MFFEVRWGRKVLTVSGLLPRPLQTVAVSLQPDITKSKRRLSSSSGLLSLSTLAMLQNMVRLSVWCRLYPVLFHQQLFLFGLSPSWHWGGLLSVSTVWRPSCLLLHPLWVSLGWTFCFSVYMLLGAKSIAKQRWSEIMCKPVETKDYIIAVTTGSTPQVCNYYCIILHQLFHGNAPL